MSPWEKLLERPHSRGHVVQLYEPADELSLGANVSRYVWEGLKRGEGALVVATPIHRELFCEQLARLGADPQSAITSGQLKFLDAWETLSRCLAGPQPDWGSFESVIGAALGRPLSKESRRPRACLWRNGRPPLEGRAVCRRQSPGTVVEQVFGAIVFQPVLRLPD